MKIIEINNVTVLQDSQIRLPYEYNESVGNNYQIHLGKNVFTLNEIITKGLYTCIVILKLKIILH